MGVDWGKIKEEAAQILSDYIKVDTTNPPGKEMAGARYLQGLLEKDGFPATVLESQPERGNLICTMKGKDRSSAPGSFAPYGRGARRGGKMEAPPLFREP